MPSTQSSLEHPICMTSLNLGGCLVLEMREAESCVNCKWL